MSLDNVILIHVSTLYAPRNEHERQKEENDEYYNVLQLPRFAPLPEIRKAYRQATLQLQCDRMMLAWKYSNPNNEPDSTTNHPTDTEQGNSNEVEGAATHPQQQHQTQLQPQQQQSELLSKEKEAATKALDDRETKIKGAFRVLGDKSFRQQYHLLECRPSRYKVIQGPLATVQSLTSSRRWFTILVLQAVIVAAMVNAITAQMPTQKWVLILIPTWAYYGLVVLFWFSVLEFPCCRPTVTMHTFATTFSMCAQHAANWLGIFFVARYWDRATLPLVNWYILSIPFYLAILFRCHATHAAVQALRDLQAKMVSREHVQTVQQQKQQQQLAQLEPQQNVDLDAQNDLEAVESTTEDTDNILPQHHNIRNDLSNDYIVITKDAELLADRLMQSPLTNEELDAHTTKAAKMNRLVVNTSPEFRQVDAAARSLRQAAVKLAVLGTSFVLLVSLKLERALPVSFWVIFTPIWIHFLHRLILAYQQPWANRRQNRRTNAATNTPARSASNNTNSPNQPTSAAPTEFTEARAGAQRPAGILRNANNKKDSEEGSVAVEAIGSGLFATSTFQVGEGMNPTAVNSSSSRESISPRDVSTATDHSSVAKASAPADTLPSELSASNPEAMEGEMALLSNVLKDSKNEVEFDLEAGEGTPHHGIENVSVATTGEEGIAFDDKALPRNGASTKASIVPSGKQSDVTAVQNDGANQLALATQQSAAHVEFERWQSVYENTEVRSIRSPYIPCEVFFHVLTLCLIVAKLDRDYGNNDPNNAGFSAFLIILVPFCIGFGVCCCAIVAGCIQLAREEIRSGNSESSAMNNLDANAATTVRDESQNNFLNNAGMDEEAPMRAGVGSLQSLMFSTHIDIPRQDLNFAQRIHVFTSVLSVSSTDVETWLIEHGDSTQSFWDQLVACAESLSCSTVNYDDNNSRNDLPQDHAWMSQFHTNPEDQEWLSFLRENLQAFFDKANFQKALEKIQPIDEENIMVEDGPIAEDEAGMECPVCCENYKITDMVHCEGDPIHFFCRVCFHRYANETIQSGGITGMPCAHANCEATFATPIVRSNLSSWDILRMEEREANCNTNVALAAKAVLSCTCGAVGVVTEEDIGDGCIKCPGTSCQLEFCALCGNQWHPDTNCSPSKTMLQWVVKNTMPCPNCHTPIEKNAGCDHMYCAPPGGCGHHFSYRTGKPMSKDGRTLRGIY